MLIVMYYFLLEQIVLISLGIMVYLIVRTLPRVNGFELAQHQEAARKRLTVRIKQEWVDMLDAKMVRFLEKTLRRAKVWLLRVDNYVSRHLDSIMMRGISKKDSDQQLSIFEEDSPAEPDDTTDNKQE